MRGLVAPVRDSRVGAVTWIVVSAISHRPLQKHRHTNDNPLPLQVTGTTVTGTTDASSTAQKNRAPSARHLASVMRSASNLRAPTVQNP